MSIDIKDRVRGSLVGGAVGDALGYPVEFMSYQQIVSRYGAAGITRYEVSAGGVAEISDDTQMTLFTANGLLFGYTRGVMRGIMGQPWDYIQDAYLEWLQTQTGDIDYTKWHYSWIREVKELHSLRAPGNTCLQALRAIASGKEAVNNSKGCGGVMRIAPIPLYYSGEKRQYYQATDTVRVAGEAARITHKHPLGYLPAALLGYLIDALLRDEQSSATASRLAHILDDGVKVLRDVWPDQQPSIDALHRLMEQAAHCAGSPLSDQEAVRQLGDGWTGEEALAIAVCCAMRYPDNFEQAVVAAVNHSGDSDSTGAVTGNIVGAICGYDAIPAHFKDHLELHRLILELADDLAGGVAVGEYEDNDATPAQRRWMDKYVEGIFLDKVPIRHSYLVDRELGIYAGEYPGDKDSEKCRQKMAGTWGDFAHFYDLTEEGELEPYRQYLEPWQQHHRFPIADVSIPDSTEHVRRLVEEIILHGRQGAHGHGRIYIHCWGGVGRTGTIVACLYAYLLRGQGLTADAIYRSAMQQLDESFARCPKSKYRTSPEANEQRLFVRRFVERECRGL